MKLTETRIHHGGMMRCCIATIVEHVERVPDAEAVDQDLACKYEGVDAPARLKLRSGRWAIDLSMHKP